ALNAANVYTGGTTITNGAAGTNSGFVRLGNASALSTGTVTFSAGGSLANSVGGNFAIDNPIVFNNAVVQLDNPNNTSRTFFTGPITLNGNNQILVNANAGGEAVFFSGVVSGAG